MSAPRCPFLHAVSEGRIDDAKAIALGGPEPAEPAIIPVLLQWATEAAEAWLAARA